MAKGVNIHVTQEARMVDRRSVVDDLVQCIVLISDGGIIYVDKSIRTTRE